ncbi:uncharacterized protein [Amphiura filiformis]|uniref:uncharacterized protein n=1 Tax=Amphiura filiformis TaxID=82378 RepID=UPI003B21F894
MPDLHARLGQLEREVRYLRQQINSNHFNRPRQRSSIPQQRDVIAYRVTGHVKWFNVRQGYGFITRDDTCEDVFVYKRGIAKNNPAKLFPSVGDGEVVEFDIIFVPGRTPEADNVTGPNGACVLGSEHSPNIVAYEDNIPSDSTALSNSCSNDGDKNNDCEELTDNNTGENGKTTADNLHDQCDHKSVCDVEPEICKENHSEHDECVAPQESSAELNVVSCQQLNIHVDEHLKRLKLEAENISSAPHQLLEKFMLEFLQFQQKYLQFYSTMHVHLDSCDIPTSSNMSKSPCPPEAEDISAATRQLVQKLSGEFMQFSEKCLPFYFSMKVHLDASDAD